MSRPITDAHNAALSAQRAAQALHNAPHGAYSPRVIRSAWLAAVQAWHVVAALADTGSEEWCDAIRAADACVRNRDVVPD